MEAAFLFKGIRLLNCKFNLNKVIKEEEACYYLHA